MAKPKIYTEVAFTTVPSSTSPAWEDVTSYVLHEAGINLEKWRSEEFSTCQPSRSSWVFKNADGRFTPGKTGGAYYPNVKKGRRIRQVSTMFPNTGFDIDTTGWAGSNATLAQVSTPVRSGAGAMRLTATAAADMSADTPSGTSGVPVVAGAVYVLSGWFRTAVTSRSCKMRADWYTAAGAFISSSDTGTVADSTSAYTSAEARVTAPATAAFARLRAMVTAPAASEVHYVDAALLGLVRFSGYIDDWQVSWPGKIASYATCTVTARSRFSRLGTSIKLKSINEETVLADDPAVLYTMGEPAGATTASDSSGNNQPAMSIEGGNTSSDPAGSVTFGTEAGPLTDDLTAALFSDSTNAKYLRSRGLAIPMSGGFTVEAWVSTHGTNGQALFCDSGTYLYDLTASGIVVWLNGNVDVQWAPAGLVTLTGPALTAASGLNHIVVTYNSTETVLYVNGVSVDSAATTASTSTIRELYAGFAGTNQLKSAALYAAYPVALTPTQVTAHYNAGTTGFANETPAARLARYAAFAGVPAAETSFETGDVLNLAHIDTTGKTALACMREVETTESGVLFDAGDGTLTFHDRSHRYAQSSAFTLTASKVVTPLEPILDDQQLVNDMTVTGSTGISARVVDEAAIDEADGVYDSTLDIATSNADEPRMAAGWRVGRYATPKERIPAVEVSLAKADDATVAAVLAAQVGTKFTVTGLPSNGPATSMTLFVEGMAERIDATDHRITLKTSPAELFDVWILDDSTYSVLDTTTRLGY